jgi:hypothetical protein
LDKRAEQILPGSKEGGGEREGDREQRKERPQTMYTHMNKCINNLKNKK